MELQHFHFGLRGLRYRNRLPAAAFFVFPPPGVQLRRNCVGCLGGSADGTNPVADRSGFDPAGLTQIHKLDALAFQMVHLQIADTIGRPIAAGLPQAADDLHGHGEPQALPPWLTA